MIRRWLFIALLIPLAGYAAIEAVQFDDAAKAERYHHLIKELRCLVCQNESLADSNADLAKDMRHKAYELIKGGATNQDVIDYMVKRYGDFVLYRPPLMRRTLLLWLGPFVILAGGVFILMLLVRRKGKSTGAVSQKDLKRARALLGEEDNHT